MPCHTILHHTRYFRLLSGPRAGARLVRTGARLARLLRVVVEAVPLTDVVGGVRRELVRRHADDDPVRGGVHDASKPPEVLRQEQPAAPARLRDAEGVERKADVDEVEPILVVARGPSPRRPPAPPALEVVE